MAITRQPVKGRKKHGGIRLGEMERDALLSHGVAFCLHDRYVRYILTDMQYVQLGCWISSTTSDSSNVTLLGSSN